MANEYQGGNGEGRDSQSLPTMDENRSNPQWSPPPIHMLKINVDGSTCHSRAAAAIVQNHNDEFFVGFSKSLHGCLAKEAEAWGFLIGI